LLLLSAMEKVMVDQGARVAPGAGIAAAIANYSGAEAAIAVSRA